MQSYHNCLRIRKAANLNRSLSLSSCTTARALPVVLIIVCGLAFLGGDLHQAFVTSGH